MKQSVVNPPSWTENASSSTHSLLISFGHLVSQQSLRTGIWLKPQKIIRTSWGQKKGVLASSALDHNRRTAVGAKSWAVAAKTWLWSVMISYDKKSHKTWLSRSTHAIPQLRDGLWLRLCFGFPQKTQNLPFEKPRDPPAAVGFPAICHEKKNINQTLASRAWLVPDLPNKMRKMAASKLWIPQEMHAL